MEPMLFYKPIRLIGTSTHISCMSEDTHDYRG